MLLTRCWTAGSIGSSTCSRRHHLLLRARSSGCLPTVLGLLVIRHQARERLHSVLVLLVEGVALGDLLVEARRL